MAAAAYPDIGRYDTRCIRIRTVLSLGDHVTAVTSELQHIRDTRSRSLASNTGETITGSFPGCLALSAGRTMPVVASRGPQVDLMH